MEKYKATILVCSMKQMVYKIGYTGVLQKSNQVFKKFAIHTIGLLYHTVYTIIFYRYFGLLAEICEGFIIS